MAPTPGLLYVTMQPRPGLSKSQFQDWYHNEHGPLRVRLPFITNGLRYRAIDLDGNGKGLPEWVALYDVTDMEEMNRPAYLALREQGVHGGKTQREVDTMAQIAVRRRLFDLLCSRQADNFRPVDELDDAASAGATLVAVSLCFKPECQNDLIRWYREEHISLLAKVPGWRRTRVFLTSQIDPSTAHELLALHEYSAQNGLGGVEHMASMATTWHNKIMADVVTEKSRRVYQWYYTFGPAPRDLASLASESGTKLWSSNDGRTRTFPSRERPAIESYITTPDGVDLTYRLEGSAEPNAPLLVLSNSILVDWSIWDGFLDAFYKRPENRSFRVLRYLTRGRTGQFGSQPITIDVLANDIIALLNALRVPSAAACIGVSLGGVTVLNAALLQPERIAAFIACDTNSASPASNSKVWSERVAMAESEGAVSPATGEALVGENLAEATVRRWFVPTTFEDPRRADRAAHVKQVVANNCLDGFRHAVQALCAYDVRDRMAQARVPGLFVAGAGDGVLPQTMKQMATDLKGSAELKIIDDAGHLPMVEQPDVFADIVGTFLKKVR